MLKIDFQLTKVQLLEIKRWLKEEYTQNNDGLFSHWKIIERCYESNSLILGICDDRPIAFITFNKIGSKVVCDLLSVKETHRGNEFGKVLVLGAIELFKRDGIKKVEVDCLNIEAEVFFQKIGFVKDENPIVYSTKSLCFWIA